METFPVSKQSMKLIVCLQTPGLFSDGFLVNQLLDVNHDLNCFIHR